MNSIIGNVDPYTFTGSAILIGFLLINELSNDEQDSVGNWLQLVGLIMQTYASQVTTNQSLNNNNNVDSSSNCDIETLKKAIDKIKENLEKM